MVPPHGALHAGRYRIVRELARGPMSIVLEAEDVELGRPVAVKLLAPGADRQRFNREARAGAGLDHPNVCRVFDFGQTAEGPYLVTELLSGGTLEERLTPGRPLADDATTAVAIDVAAALAYAHGRGVIHRDVKPANVLFDSEGRAKLADFGIAALAGDEALTAAGTVLGTATYMSPEQARGDPASAASDVYSFGVILYRLLSGQLPYGDHPDALSAAEAHANAEPMPFTSRRSDAPTHLRALATAALAKDAADRPRDGAELLSALDAGAPRQATAATVIAAPAIVQAPVRPRRPGRRTAVIAGVLLAVAVAAYGLASVANRGKADNDNAPPTAPGGAEQGGDGARPASQPPPPAATPSDNQDTPTTTSEDPNRTERTTTAVPTPSPAPPPPPSAPQPPPASPAPPPAPAEPPPTEPAPPTEPPPTEPPPTQPPAEPEPPPPPPPSGPPPAQPTPPPTPVDPAAATN